MAGFWRVASKAFVWITCTAGFLYQASDVLQLYLKHAFTVTVYKEHGSRHIRFPAVTVCTEKWSKRAVLCGNNSFCQEGTDALAERLLYDPDLRNEAAYTPSELFNCHMRSQDDKCAAFSCVSMIRRTFYRTPFLMCYTFDLYQYAEPSHPFRSCEVPWLYGKRVMCEVALQSHLSLWKEQRLRRAFRRLPYPSASRCSDYRSRGRISAYFGYMNYEVQKCVKILPRDRNIKFCKQRCTLPCSELTYDVKLVGLAENEIYSKPASGFLETGYSDGNDFCFPPYRSSFAAIIRFSTSSQTVYDYQRRLTGQEALAYIGGYIGMWLGISLYSVYVFLETSLTTFLRTRWHVFRHLVHR
ncbi:hypothetical protein MRX96_019426 [Rhipicephalus microplus]